MSSIISGIKRNFMARLDKNRFSLVAANVGFGKSPLLSVGLVWMMSWVKMLTRLRTKVDISLTSSVTWRLTPVITSVNVVFSQVLVTVLMWGEVLVKLIWLWSIQSISSPNQNCQACQQHLKIKLYRNQESYSQDRFRAQNNFIKHKREEAIMKAWLCKKLVQCKFTQM